MPHQLSFPGKRDKLFFFVFCFRFFFSPSHPHNCTHTQLRTIAPQLQTVDSVRILWHFFVFWLLHVCWFVCICARRMCVCASAWHAMQHERERVCACCVCVQQMRVYDHTPKGPHAAKSVDTDGDWPRPGTRTRTRTRARTHLFHQFKYLELFLIDEVGYVLRGSRRRHLTDARGSGRTRPGL